MMDHQPSIPKSSFAPFIHLSVRGRFFSTILAIILVMELLSGVAFHRHLTQWLFDHTVKQNQQATKAIVQQLKERLDQSHTPGQSLASIIDLEAPRLVHLGETLNVRISLISAQGRLLFDTALSTQQTQTAERHSDRQEIKVAMKGMLGISRRWSKTIQQDLIYVAEPIYASNGQNLGVVRLAKSAITLDAQLAHLSNVLWSIFAVSLALALMISGWAARMLSQTLQRLVVLARDLAHGESYSGHTFEGKDEYSRLARSLTKLATQIEDQVGRLADSRDRFEAVLDSMREGVIALDEENHISLANKSACKLFGWRKPPLNDHIDDCVDEESLILFIREQLAEDVPWVELEFQGRRTVLACLTPQSNSGESVLVLSDITALRRLETVRRDFVQNVSHELRTPTTVIRANAETLLDGAMDDPELARQFLEGIDRNAQRLSHLVSDLLDLSRIESGTYQMQADVVKPRSIIRRVVDTLADQLITKNIKVKIKIDEDLELSQDAGALEQVFTNLIENAVNYSDESGCVTLAAQKLTKQDYRHGQNFIRFEVIDDGPGIAHKHQLRIFERFYRVDKGRSRHLGGTGLGLAIVKHLCQAMGGEVGLNSTEGEGCTFWFVLPENLS